MLGKPLVAHAWRTLLQTRPRLLCSQRVHDHPAGITCRWATKHAAFDQLTWQHLIQPQQRGDADQPAAADPGAAGASKPAAAAAEPHGSAAASPAAEAQPAALVRADDANDAAQPAEDATWAAGSTAPLQRSSETAALAATTAACSTAAVPTDSAHPQQHAPASGAGAAAPRSDASWLNGVGAGGSSVQPLAAARVIDELPVAAALPESTNTLSKDVQIRLRCVLGMSSTS